MKLRNLKIKDKIRRNAQVMQVERKDARHHDKSVKTEWGNKEKARTFLTKYL